MSGTALVTGATGAVGTALCEALACRGFAVTGVARRASSADATTVLSWRIGDEPPPPEIVDCRWDVVVHAAASTRWTMTPEEAVRANVDSVDALAPLRPLAGRLVHVSTAFVEDRTTSALVADSDNFRNPYEWSKALAEARVREQWPEAVVVRPALVIGSRRDGAINRFSGSYTLIRSIASGMAPAVVGNSDAAVELVPVDVVAEVLVDAVTGSADGDIVTIGCGPDRLEAADVVSIVCDGLNDFRAENGVTPVTPPPFIDPERWHRFLLPFARQEFTPLQLRAISLLEEFATYLESPPSFEPSVTFEGIADALRHSTRWWAAHNRSAALRPQREWTRGAA